MNAYTINQQLDSLYKDLEAAHNNDDGMDYDALCRVQGISRYA